LFVLIFVIIFIAKLTRKFRSIVCIFDCNFHFLLFSVNWLYLIILVITLLKLQLNITFLFSLLHLCVVLMVHWFIIEILVVIISFIRTICPFSILIDNLLNTLSFIILVTGWSLFIRWGLLARAWSITALVRATCYIRWFILLYILRNYMLFENQCVALSFGCLLYFLIIVLLSIIAIIIHHLVIIILVHILFLILWWIIKL